MLNEYSAEFAMVADTIQPIGDGGYREAMEKIKVGDAEMPKIQKVAIEFHRVQNMEEDVENAIKNGFIAPEGKEEFIKTTKELLYLDSRIDGLVAASIGLAYSKATGHGFLVRRLYEIARDGTVSRGNVVCVVAFLDNVTLVYGDNEGVKNRAEGSKGVSCKGDDDVAFIKCSSWYDAILETLGKHERIYFEGDANVRKVARMFMSGNSETGSVWMISAGGTA